MSDPNPNATPPTLSEIGQGLEKIAEQLDRVIRDMTINPALTGIVPSKPPRPKFEIWAKVTDGTLKIRQTVELVRELEASS